MTAQEQLNYKNRIITQLYNSGDVHAKVHGICWRNRIHKDTLIHEDIVQETFYYIAKKSAAEIIEMYEDNPKRLLGLAVTIAVLKGVATNKNDAAYPKHSLARHILFASNLQKYEHLSPTENIDENNSDFTQVLVDHSTDEDPEKELWVLIRSELTPEELETLEYHLNLKKKQGRYKREVKIKYNQLLERIEEIIIKHKIHI